MKVRGLACSNEILDALENYKAIIPADADAFALFFAEV